MWEVDLKSADDLVSKISLFGVSIFRSILR